MPPKVYSKLYAYFDKTLVSSSESRKRARQEEHQRGEEKRKVPERYAPSQEKSLDGFRANRTPKRGMRFGGMKKDARLPKWVGPSVRLLCKGLDTGKAVPHVYAGVESVLFMPCPAGEEGRMMGKIPALIAAIWFFVVTRMAGKEAEPAKFNEERKKVLGILKGLKGNEEVTGKVGSNELDWEGCESVLKKDVDAWIEELAKKGWLDLDWYENLEDGMGVAGDIEDVIEEAKEIDEESKRQKKRKKELGQNIGRGTMMQEQFNYLSEEKRRAHAEWQKKMLDIIDKQIANGILHGNMDTAEG